MHRPMVLAWFWPTILARCMGRRAASQSLELSPLRSIRLSARVSRLSKTTLRQTLARVDRGQSGFRRKNGLDTRHTTIFYVVLLATHLIRNILIFRRVTTSLNEIFARSGLSVCARRSDPERAISIEASRDSAPGVTGHPSRRDTTATALSPAAGVGQPAHEGRLK